MKIVQEMIVENLGLRMRNLEKIFRERREYEGYSEIEDYLCEIKEGG